MKRWFGIAVVSSVLALTGCGGPAADGTAAGSNTRAIGGVGNLQLSWSLQDQATGQVLTCSPGDVVQLTVAGLTQAFDCTLGAAVSSPLAAGFYNVRFDLIDSGGGLQSTATTSMTVFEGINDVPIVFEVTQIALSWSLQKVAGAPVTCSATEEVHFSLTNLDVPGSQRLEYAFPCGASAGVVRLSPGNYQLQGVLLAAAGGAAESKTPAITTQIPGTQSFVFVIN
jgi:hypothetical protein